MRVILPTLSFSLVAALALDASAQPKPPPEAELGTVEVTGSAGGSLPRLAILPLDDGDAETIATLKKDLDRLGVWDVVEPAAMPAGPFEKDSPLDLKPFKNKGIAVVVRARKDGPVVRAEAWLSSSGDDPLVKHAVTLGSDPRRATHALADKLVSALTGRTGPFDSHLAFTLRTAKGRQVFSSDFDGLGKVAHGSADDTALSPTFGPHDEVWFTISKSYDPFKLVHGPAATELPTGKAGSVLSVAFSPDRTKLAIAVMKDEASKIYRGNADATELAPVETTALPNRPALGPLGKLAWVASGGGTQRVYVDGHAVSPAGFHASAPTFCDSPQGLLVVFTVGVGSGADLLATDTSGGNLRRLTQGHGSNAYPACSPDGRLVAFFSTGANGKSPGLYTLPLSNPTRIRRLTDDHGDSLAWAR